jgi:hypothetical protein
MSRDSQAVKKLLAICATLAAAFASTVMYIAFQHNPQGEFFDPQTGKIDGPYSLLLFAASFALALLATGVVSVGLWAIVRLVRSRSKQIP